MSKLSDTEPEDAYTAGQLTQLLGQSAPAANQDSALASLFAPADAASQSEAAKRQKLSEPDDEEETLDRKKKKNKKSSVAAAAAEAAEELDRSASKARVKLAKQRQQARQHDPRNPRTVFVGNVASAAKKRDLLLLFRQHGPIESVRFRSAAPSDAGVAKRLAVIHKKLSRQSLNAYIVYKEAESVAKATEALNGHCLCGLHLRVDCLKEGAEGVQMDNKKCVFLGNLSFKCDEESVRVAFGPCGRVTNVRLVRDSRTGIGRGFGFVQFADSDSVELALKLAGTEVSGRPVRVTRCSDTAKASAAVEGKKKKMQMQKTEEAAPRRQKKQKPFSASGGNGKFEDNNSGGRLHGNGEIKARRQNQKASQQQQQRPRPSAKPTNRTFVQAFQRMLDKRRK